MNVGNYTVRATRWPWQGYGWFPHRTGRGPVAPLNHTGARFGGGWRWRIGVMIGDGSIIIDLLFGSIRIDRRAA